MKHSTSIRAVLAAALLAGCNAILGVESDYQVVSNDTNKPGCTLNSECTGGFNCLFATCSKPCNADGDCPENRRCLPTDTLAGTACVSSAQASCRTASDCPKGTVCTSTGCRTGCTTTADCLSDQTCSGGECVGTPDHDPGVDAGAKDSGAGGNLGSGGSPSGGSGGRDASSGNGGAGGLSTGGGGAGGTNTGGAAGDGGAVVPGPIGQVGLRCTPNGSYACAGHAQRGQLVCTGGIWATNGSCAPGTNCDTGSTNLGFCNPVVSECDQKTAGYAFCRGRERFECGADLVTAESLETCQYVCSAGACTGKCVPDAKDCGGGGDAGAGRVPRTCQSDGTWLDGAPCPFVCSAGACVAATCGDSVKNGDETDVDCGGSCGPTCALTKSCGADSDCVLPASGKCSAGRCVAAACTDGVKNGSETDADCGGGCATKCAAGKKCGTNGDCAVSACVTGTCTGVCSPGTTQCSGVGFQTCGPNGTWGNPVGCATTQMCQGGACVTCPSGTGNCDSNGANCETNLNSTATCGTTCATRVACTNTHASSSTCSAGKCNFVCANRYGDCDGVGTNGCETNLNSSLSCGSTCANAMVCPSGNPHCNNGTCTSPSSCTSLAKTCGPAGNESCCASPIVTGNEGTSATFYRGYDAVSYTSQANPATVSDFRLDRFEITVGRFRKFLSAWNAGWRPSSGDGKHAHLNGGSGLTNSSGATAHEAGWNPSWTANVAPTTANLQCAGNWQTWTGTAGANENRPMVCENWYEAYAFCIWDGGFLPSEAEWNYAASGGSQQRVYPWSNPPNSTTINCTYANFQPNGIYCVDDPNGGLNDVGSESTKGDGRYFQADLSGNANEFVLDWQAAYVNVCINCAYLPATATDKVLRGGSLNADAAALLSSFRGVIGPTGRAARWGARCARAP